MTPATLALPTQAAFARHERRLLVAAGLIVTVLAWWWLVVAAHDRSSAAAALLHAHHSPVTLQTLLAVVLMWQMMMVAMMAPIVLRWVVTFGALVSEAVPGRRVTPTVGAFAAGYFTIWLGYSLAGGSVQLALQRAGVIDLHHGMGAGAAGMVLLAAGLFQQSAFKRACLAHCRSPLGYFLTRWRNGPMGGFRLGLAHGLYCAGCCWAMMAAALAVGVMNLMWMALLTILLCVEQVAPHGGHIGRGIGWAMVIWGLVLVFNGYVS